MTGTTLGLMRIVTVVETPVPTRLAARSTTAKSPLCVGVPVTSPVLASTARPDGSPVAENPPVRTGWFVALIWMDVIAVPTVPVTAGDAARAGVAVTTGAALGLTRIVTDAALPVPTRLAARSTTAKSPLCVGVPVISPVLALTDRPDGSPVAE